MATFYRAFRDHTQTIGALTSLVGARVYAIKYPQTPTYPAIRVTRIGEPVRDYSLSGDTRLVVVRYQIEVSDSEDNASDPLESVLAVAMQLAELPANGGFSGFTGALGTAPNQLAVGVMTMNGQFETYDPEELRVVRSVQDWRVQQCQDS